MKKQKTERTTLNVSKELHGIMLKFCNSRQLSMAKWADKTLRDKMAEEQSKEKD